MTRTETDFVVKKLLVVLYRAVTVAIPTELEPCIPDPGYDCEGNCIGDETAMAFVMQTRLLVIKFGCM